jgi:hypothetical protein
MSNVDPDPLTKLALEIAQRRTEENKELAAAYGEYDADLASAWTQDPEFGDALNSAILLEDIRPLKTYLYSDKPLSRGNRQALAAYIDLLAKSKAKRKRGRPRRKAAKARPAEQAERNAAWLVAAALKGWRKESGRARVPQEIFEGFVQESRQEAARVFGVSLDVVHAGNIRNYARKSGRIVVP